MKLPRHRFLHLAAGAAALPALSRFAWAQAYPARPVHWIVGGPDIAARLMGQWLSERLGQQVVVEDPVSRPIRTAPGAFDLTNAAIASGSESTMPPRRTDPAWFTTQIDVRFNDTSSPT
jgi:hypothetical protein